MRGLSETSCPVALVFTNYFHHFLALFLNIWGATQNFSRKYVYFLFYRQNKHIFN